MHLDLSLKVIILTNLLEVSLVELLDYYSTRWYQGGFQEQGREKNILLILLYIIMNEFLEGPDRPIL